VNLKTSTTHRNSRPKTVTSFNIGLYLTYTPPAPGEPVQIDVRVQLRKNNANYGMFSMFTTITVNP
jgi:hypothetical protein